MNLHRDLAQVQFGGDLLVSSPNHDERHDMPLALGQSGVALAQVRDENGLAARGPIVLDRRMYRVEQLLVVKRLRQELKRTGLHSAQTHRYVAVTGDKDD